MSDASKVIINNLRDSVKELGDGVKELNKLKLNNKTGSSSAYDILGAAKRQTGKLSATNLNFTFGLAFQGLVDPKDIFKGDVGIVKSLFDKVLEGEDVAGGGGNDVASLLELCMWATKFVNAVKLRAQTDRAKTAEPTPSPPSPKSDTAPPPSRRPRPSAPSPAEKSSSTPGAVTQPSRRPPPQSNSQAQARNATPGASGHNSHPRRLTTTTTPSSQTSNSESTSNSKRATQSKKRSAPSTETPERSSRQRNNNGQASGSALQNGSPESDAADASDDDVVEDLDWRVGSAVLAEFGDYGYWPALIVDPKLISRSWWGDHVEEVQEDPSWKLYKCIPVGNDWRWGDPQTFKKILRSTKVPSNRLNKSDQKLYAQGLSISRDKQKLKEWAAVETDLEVETREELEDQ